MPTVHCVLAMGQHSQGNRCCLIPQGPWKLISQDLFKQGGRWYSVTVDHYSDWFEVDLLNEDINAANVISAHFARYGIPDTFLSDNRPQYISQEF